MILNNGCLVFEIKKVHWSQNKIYELCDPNDFSADFTKLNPQTKDVITFKTKSRKMVISIHLCVFPTKTNMLNVTSFILLFLSFIFTSNLHHVECFPESSSGESKSEKSSSGTYISNIVNIHFTSCSIMNQVKNIV